MTDDLTGLHNLRSFEVRLSKMIRTAHETKTPLSLLVLDLDRLKSLNDVHGHLAGAEAVRTVGRILAASLPLESAACRYGGDEFVVGLPRSGQPEAIGVAEKLRGTVNAVAPILAGVPFPAGTLSISIGAACRSFGQNRALDASLAVDAAGEALFLAADAALYAAKNGGRNRISVASHGDTHVKGTRACAFHAGVSIYAHPPGRRTQFFRRIAARTCGARVAILREKEGWRP